MDNNADGDIDELMTFKQFKRYVTEYVSCEND